MEQHATEWLNYQALILNIWNKLQQIRKFVIITKKGAYFMRKGFTLSELLLSLVIIGVVATLTVPVLLNNVHNKTFVSQIKNMSATIEQLAQDELIAHRTRDLSDTDFGDPEKLLSDKHFFIAKSCTSDESLTKCWKTNATGKDKIQYKFLNRQNMGINVGGRTIVLKNGVMFRYSEPTGDEKTSGDVVCKILMDVNGNDKPNIVGRDLFGFYITNKGKVVDRSYAAKSNDSLSTKINNCKTNVWYCYGALADNGWKMDY